MRLQSQLLSWVAACLLACSFSSQAGSTNQSGVANAALREAIRRDSVKKVSTLLTAQGSGLDVGLNANGVTPLMLACSMGSYDVAKYLLGQGADFEARTVLQEPDQFPESGGCTPLLLACAAGHGDIANLLLECGAHIDRPDARGNTPLMAACANGHLETVKFLLKHGADVQYRDGYGATPLLRAIQKGHTPVAEYLLEQGADLHATFDNGRDALALAAERGNPALVQLLIEKGAADDPKEATAALLDAAAGGRTKVVPLLLKKGAALNSQDEEGWTPLLKAAALGHADTVKVLCEAGADPTKRNRYGRTALDYARGLPGTEGLSTNPQLQEAAEHGVFNEAELYYVLARKAQASGSNYERIIKALEQTEKRFKRVAASETNSPPGA